ncbi:MAG TPA: Type 1 glutamine amidotransferase-like domain-containing protein [Ktedonobacterales bacterium]
MLAWRAICGATDSPLCRLGWKSLGVLELTALPSIDDTAWIPTVQETDALLVWGGDVLYLCHWMRQSGLADLLPQLARETVYMGVSAGSMAVTATFGETYRDRRHRRRRLRGALEAVHPLRRSKTLVRP